MAGRCPAIVLCALLWAFWAGTSAAAELAVPQGPVILTVAGSIERTNADGEARFDRAMLVGLEWIEVETHTPWTEGPQRFAGVPLRRLLAAVGARGEVVTAVALNDYSATIPIDDASRFGALLALDQNGEAMTVRNKGPIWIVYPQSGPDGPTTERHNEKMVWQLRRLEVR